MECFDARFREVCAPRFDRLEKMILSLDNAIRGNGVPGINERLRDLESGRNSRGKLFWIVVGTVVAVIGGVAGRILVP